ncbi:MAG TPA: FAD binding domain-containing protein [Bosea sp. (in: a-proteobacteria)]|uniref:FAD binding domain-containing protein n=1 Tax=Bosea sp. (in: a-proteobacteria) TaxID=1871050 RepID=UPI002E11CC4B|nr:FAD binding domain-containing protein [Bosea sp. (in: a-proteobacteria)]
MLGVRNCTTMAEAAGILSGDRHAVLLGGGTLVMRDVNEGRLTEGTLVRVTDPAFRQINAGGGRIELGAGVTMAQILASRDLAFLHPAARAIGGPAIRNMATVGGNLFAACPYGDFTVALLALDAQVVLHAGFGSGRATPLDEFLAGRDRGTTPGLVAGVQFSRPANPGDFRFRKISRVKPKGISVLSIAAHLPAQAGRIMQPRVAYGAMAPAPIRARGVERALENKTLDAAAIQAAKQAALEGCQPATDAIASEWYRREVLPVHLGRLLAGEPR